MKFNDLIYNAALAPSGHNTQPWKFSANNDTVRIYPDFSRRLPVVDPDDHALYISLGCALENLIIAANRKRFNTKVDYFPEDEKEECLRIVLEQNGTADNDHLCQAIPLRQSNRGRYNGMKIPDKQIQMLCEANIFDSVDVKVFRTDSPEIEPIIEFVKEGNRIQFNDREFVDELLSWIRFSKKEVRSRNDGLTAGVMGFPSIPRRLGSLILKTFAKPEGEARKCEKLIRNSSIMMLFICKKNEKKLWIDIGRSFERVVLTATSLGIAHAHLNMPCEVESVRKKLASHLGLFNDEQPLLLIRLGYSGELPRSPRRLITEVTINI